MSAEQHYAHTLEGETTDRWEPLPVHLDDVARLAAEHASAFDSAAWGELAGRWHDLGKYAPDFQDYLRSFAPDPGVVDASVLDNDGGRRRVDHSSAGAVLVLDRCAGRLIGPDRDKLPPPELALAMVIAGHHAGLPDWKNFEAGRLAEKRGRLEMARLGGAPADVLGLDFPPAPPFLHPRAFSRQGARDARQREQDLRFEFWTRMLFSALVDADRLATEGFMDRRRAEIREASKPPAGILGDLKARLDAHLEELGRNAKERLDRLPPGSRRQAEAVLAMRGEVLAACRRAGVDRAPGRHSLTVPTGGGKTLAALAFALDHAIRHGLRRVIVVIPFTSIIDQTAKVYRDAFGDDLAGSLVEHHSNLDPEDETYGNRLASENWDAPVVVTTSVQFFESLFSRRGTAARKLHNIAKSVVIFDEVQALPHYLRTPIFDALNQLVDHYGVSSLFCTATQPALGLGQVGRRAFPHLAGVDEVVPDVDAAFKAVAGRVVVDFTRASEPTTWGALADEIRGHDRVLVIVQRRDDARDLCRLLPPDTFHLSALMCAAHRRDVLGLIKAALKEGRTCRVVSTTLVEAGVDIDFPVVYRDLGGVDALAQAAGRCNREGALADEHGQPIPGRLIVFRSPSEPPPGLRRGAETTGTMLEDLGHLEIFDLGTYDAYFHNYFNGMDPDCRRVMLARAARDFPETAARFRMIEDEGRVSIVVPYGDAAARVAAFQAAPGRRTLRALQPFVVDVTTREADFLASRMEPPIHDQVRWIRATSQYDADRFGLIVDEIVPEPPDRLVC